MSEHLNFRPRRLLIVGGYHNDWLYAQMMPLLREKCGSSFVIASAIDRIPWFKNQCTADDDVIPVDLPNVKMRHVSEIDETDTFGRARAYEAKYGICYLRDAVQQDHSYAAYFLGYAPNSTVSRRRPPPFVVLCDYLNQSFAAAEAFLSERRIDAIINRPNGLFNTAITAVADARAIPTTFFHGSYYGGGAVWANGPYMGNEYYRDAYERTDPLDCQPLPPPPKAPSETWSRPAGPSVIKLAREIGMTTIIYGLMKLEDVKRGKKGRRVPFTDEIASQLNRFRTQSYLDRSTLDDLDAISRRPFVYMAMPFEPEYTIQSLCREFGDTTAVIRQIALCLPAGYNLVVKEHDRAGNRAIEYYRNLDKYPNIIVANPGLRGVDLIQRCTATTTMGGSTPAEAASMGKPSIIFGTQNPYGFLPSVQVVLNLCELPAALERALRPHSADEIEHYRRCADRFRRAYIAESFDATNTILFRTGTKKELPPLELAKSVDIFLRIQGAQRERLLARQRTHANGRVGDTGGPFTELAVPA